jgi:putative flippase GtrA
MLMSFALWAKVSQIFERAIKVLSSLVRLSPQRATQIITFGVLGVCVNLIYGAIFLAIVEIAPTWRIAASTVAYGTACGFQYVANAKLTFGRNARDGAQLLRYVSAVLLGYAVSTLVLGWIAPALRIPDIVALLLVAVSLPMLNFITFARWVYSSPDTTVSRSVRPGLHEDGRDQVRRNSSK